MTDKKICFLLLGSNLGDRLLFLKQAQEKISVEVGNILDRSSIYETDAWGITEQPAFLNQVLKLETPFEPLVILEKIQWIENSLGRVRHQKWYERTIDIDILLIDRQVIELENLIVPHPFLHERRFTLEPLAEIGIEQVHFKFQKTVGQLLAECKDSLEVRRIHL